MHESSVLPCIMSRSCPWKISADLARFLPASVVWPWVEPFVFGSLGSGKKLPSQSDSHNGTDHVLHGNGCPCQNCCNAPVCVQLDDVAAALHQAVTSKPHVAGTANWQTQEQQEQHGHQQLARKKHKAAEGFAAGTAGAGYGAVEAKAVTKEQKKLLKFLKKVKSTQDPALRAKLQEAVEKQLQEQKQHPHAPQQQQKVQTQRPALISPMVKGNAKPQAAGAARGSSLAVGSLPATTEELVSAIWCVLMVDAVLQCRCTVLMRNIWRMSTASISMSPLL